MKKAIVLTLGSLGFIAVAPSAVAQDPAPVQTEASAISDADIQAYAAIAAKLNTIQADAALSDAEKSAQMAAAVQDSGMEIAKFNSITEASRTDPQVRQKLQEALATP